MTRGRLLFVLCCFSVSAVTSSLRVSCVTDFFQNISCVLNVSADPEVWFSSLTFEHNTKRYRNVSCPLVAAGDSYHTDCKVKETPFSCFDEYKIKLCNKTSCQAQTWFPCPNIKLTPPPEVELQQTSESVKITCKSERYQKHMYLSDSLVFELLLQDSSSGEVRIFQLNSLNSCLQMNRSQLKPNTEYYIKARFKPDEEKTFYKATWSEWSESINWTNEDTSEPENISIILLKYLSPVFVLIIAFLVVFYTPAARLKIKSLSHTPTPAAFFQPLFQKHEGNLQDWLSPQGKFAVTYNTENDLIADVVTVVPKPVAKCPEETEVFLSTAVPQLIFPPSQTSYVGVPVMHEVPLPVTAFRPGDTPYTQLPCSVWGFGISDIEVVIPSAPVSDFLETSHTDSGCSCEDLSQSPECSLPSSPVEASPPLFCNDYCILNKTAEGVVPVLLSKENNGKVSLDFLKAEG